MFDPSLEPPIRLQAVPKIAWLPGRSGRISISTIFRWAQRGLHGVKLETLQIGGTRCTSEAALKRFFQRLQTPAESLTVTPHQRAQQIASAERQLSRAGL